LNRIGNEDGEKHGMNSDIQNMSQPEFTKIFAKSAKKKKKKEFT